MALIAWSKGSESHINSSCGTYKVCRVRRGKWLFFSAEKRVSELCWVALKLFETSDEAKQHCVDDLQEQELCQ